MRARQEADALDRHSEAVKAGRKPQLNRQFFGNGERSSEQLVHGWSAGVLVNVSPLNSVAQEAASMAADNRAPSAQTGLGKTLLDQQTSAAQRHDTVQVRHAIFQQWSQLGRRSLFDVMSAETAHFHQRVAYVNALMESAQSNTSLRSVGKGLMSWARP